MPKTPRIITWVQNGPEFCHDKIAKSQISPGVDQTPSSARGGPVMGTMQLKPTCLVEVHSYAQGVGTAFCVKYFMRFERGQRRFQQSGPGWN
eukprot:789107-Prymnesium_polylepis.1